MHCEMYWTGLLKICKKNKWKCILQKKKKMISTLLRSWKHKLILRRYSLGHLFHKWFWKWNLIFFLFEIWLYFAFLKIIFICKFCKTNFIGKIKKYLKKFKVVITISFFLFDEKGKFNVNKSTIDKDNSIFTPQPGICVLVFSGTFQLL